MNRLLLFLGIILMATACGGEQQTPPQPAANAPPAGSAAAGADAGGPTPQPTPVSLPIKPLELAENRYLDEMVAEETDKAYSGTGEFIDPARVARLLHEGRTTAPAASTGTAAPAARRQQEVKAPVTWRISGITHEEAKKLFAAGKVAEAAQKWRSLPTDSRVYTLSVEVHCSVDALRASYQKLTNLEPPLFVLPENVKGRNCYRLCLGVFTRQSDADSWLKPVGDRLPGSYPFSLAIARQ